MCLGRDTAPRWGVRAPGGGCLVSQKFHSPPPPLFPALFGLLHLPSRPVHAKGSGANSTASRGPQRPSLPPTSLTHVVPPDFGCLPSSPNPPSLPAAESSLRCPGHHTPGPVIWLLPYPFNR